MESMKTYTLPVKNFTFEDSYKEQFLKTKFYAIAEGYNLNRSSFDFAGIEECIKTDDYTFKPILGSWNKEKPSELGSGNFGGHDFDLDYDAMSGEVYSTYLGENNERPLGLILPNSAKIEEYKGRRWLTFEGLIWSEYNREAVRLLKKKRSNNVSVEIRIIESEDDERGIEVIKKFTLLGITVIGVEPGIADATLNVMDFSATAQFDKFVKVFSQEFEKLKGDELELFVKKDQYGSGPALKLDLTKESASNDQWGPINKTKLRNDILKAKNYKSIIPKAYLVVMDGWEDAPSEKLKYPIVQIKEGKVVFNINGVEAAGAYLMKEKDETYFKGARAKLNKVRNILGKEKLMSLFGVETDNDWGEEVSTNQPPIAKMQKEVSAMEKNEIISTLVSLMEDKKKYEDELTRCSQSYEEKLGDYEYAEEDSKDSAKEKLDLALEEKSKVEESLRTCEKDIVKLSESLVKMGVETPSEEEKHKEDDLIDDEDKIKAKDDKKYPEIDDEEEEFPEDTEDEDKYRALIGADRTLISLSKNHIVYVKDGELYACKYAMTETGEISCDLDNEYKCEKAYVSFKTGGTLTEEDMLPLPVVNVAVMKGITKLYSDSLAKDAKMAELEKSSEAKINAYKASVKEMLTKFDTLISEEEVPDTYKEEVRENIYNSSYKDSEDLETKVMARLYKFSKDNKNTLSGTYIQSKVTCVDKATEIANKYKNEV